MKKIWKSNAYKSTQVDYIKSQVQINKLLSANGIKDIQHNTFNNKVQIIFIKELTIEGKTMKVGVKIVVPEVEYKNKNQLYRALFHYLKSKFESLTFGFVEEYNEAFAKEFMPYLITDKQGKTISDLILPKLSNAIGHTKIGEQLYLDQVGVQER